MWGDPAHRTSIGEVSHHPNLEVLQLADLTLDRVRVQQGLGGGWIEQPHFMCHMPGSCLSDTGTMV